MKKLRIMLLVVLALGLCSVVLAADHRTSLAQSGLKPFKVSFEEQPQFEQVSGQEANRATVLNENFSSSTFPPTGWVYYNLKGIGYQWSRATNQSHSSPASASHAGGNWLSAQQSGLLVSPLIDLGVMEYDNITFWHYTDSPGNMQTGGHQFLVTDDPNHEQWYIFWEDTSPSASWNQVTVSLEGLGNLPLYFGFFYEGKPIGSNKDTWFIDDVVITSTNINVLPVINTPNPNLHRYVEATINFDSGVDEAIVWYSYDGINWDSWNMEEDDEADEPNIWWGAILAGGEMDQEVFYKIWAKDMLGNEAESKVYSYMVEDPVWVFYDYGVNSYSGYMPAGLTSNATWGAFNFFHNPFYGTGSSLYLYNTEAATSNPQTNVHLQIYLFTPAEDGNQALQRTYFATPPVVETSGVDRDVFAFAQFNNGEPIEITDQFFAIAFENLPNTGNDNTNSFFLFNTKNDYGMYGLTKSNDPGAWYTFIDASGTWVISAEIGYGRLLEVPVPELVITLEDSYPTLTWGAVEGAASYNVYASDDPYIPLNEWIPIASPWSLLGYAYTAEDPFQFFYVTASSQPDGSKAANTAKKERLNIQGKSTVPVLK
ncbi:MAG: hypothetical protein RBS31_01385 [Candidatus Syntrophosphaera sp.]|jgi:hypothetical protein|nr:hypothetical protein [Candidatus Syntrophosphaera sp.]